MAIIFPQNFNLIGLSCVLIGKFNPEMFSPAWLKYYKLVRESEADDAKVNVIHPGLTQFVAANITFSIEENRFSISSVDQSKFEMVRDLALGILTLIETTPITQMGINTDCHFKMKNEAAWHAFGNKVAPKELWNRLLERAGLKNIVIQGLNPYSVSGGEINLKVESSKTRPDSIFVQFNNHFLFPSEVNAANAILALKNKWPEVVKDSFNKTIELSTLVG